MNYTLTNQNLSVFLDGKPYMISKEAPNFEQVRDAILAGDEKTVRKIVNAKAEIVRMSEGNISYDGKTLFYRGEPFQHSITERLFHLWNTTGNVGPLLKFLNNLMKNPSKRSVDCLYRFLDHNSLPITDDGCFMAYKMIRENWTDFHTGKIDNSIGAEPSMDRNMVDEDPDRTCSHGLHACSIEYVTTAYGSGGRLVSVKINPADVVAVPRDYNNSKLRCCRYVVVAELDKGEHLPDWYMETESVEDWDEEDDFFESTQTSTSQKLEVSDVWEILDHIEDGTFNTIQELADEYGVNESTIRKIRDGKTWQDIVADWKEDKETDKAFSKGTKLDEIDVKDIKHNLKMGFDTIQKLADDYGVNESTIRKIRDGKIWKHVTI